MRVSGDYSPISIVIHCRLLELELKSVWSQFDALDSRVLLDGHAILVPGQLGVAGDLGHNLEGGVHAGLLVLDLLLELRGSRQVKLA